MKRIFARAAAGAACAVGPLLASCSSTPPAPTPEPPDVPCLAEGDVRVGGFRFALTQGSGGSLDGLVIRHRGAPDRVVFASAPGVSLLAAAKANLTATERRGSFTVSPNLEPLCEGATVSAVACEGAQLAVKGTLAGCGLGYTLTFEEAGPGRLALGFTTADAAYNYLELRYGRQDGERYLGFGEQFTHLDLAGKRVEILTQEQGIGRGDAVVTPVVATAAAGSEGSPLTSYAPLPVYLTTERRGFYLANTEYSVFDLTKPGEVRLGLHAPALRGGIVRADEPLGVLEGLTAGTGRMPALPPWVHEGAIVGMQGGTDAVRNVLRELTARGTPIAGFWLQDWVGRRQTSFGSQLWWNWELDTERYPAWPELLAEVRAAGGRMLGYVNPFLVDAASKPGVRRNLYAEAQERGYLVSDDGGKVLTVTLTDFPAAMVDLSNPAARAWLLAILTEALTTVGLDGWMADFAESLPFEARLASGETGAVAHNRYPVDWAALNREALRAAGKEGQGMFFTRAGGMGSARESTLFWLGDQNVTWDEFDGLASAVIGLLSGGLSGITLNHWDIGGYTTLPELGVSRSKELLLRWMEISAFTAVYRTHEGNRPASNAQFYSDAESLDAFARFARVYKGLSAYRRRAEAEAVARGWPIVRHPWLHAEGDVAFLDLPPTELEFLLGSDILVAPVLAPGVNRRPVRLPPGRWVHLFRGDASGDAGASTVVEVEAPLGTPAVFVRESAAPEIRRALQSAGALP